MPVRARVSMEVERRAASRSPANAGGGKSFGRKIAPRSGARTDLGAMFALLGKHKPPAICPHALS